MFVVMLRYVRPARNMLVLFCIALSISAIASMQEPGNAQRRVVDMASDWTVSMSDTCSSSQGLRAAIVIITVEAKTLIHENFFPRVRSSLPGLPCYPLDVDDTTGAIMG